MGHEAPVSKLPVYNGVLADPQKMRSDIKHADCQIAGPWQELLRSSKIKL